MDSGIHSKSTHSFYFCGPSNNTHHFGTGFFVDKLVDHLVIGFVPINKYMCTLRIKTNKQKISLLNVHAPTELKEDDVKEAFYSELERVYDSLPSSDVKIILGDFNAQIGKEQCFQSVAGLHSLHSANNDNGCRLASYALSNGLIIRSTQFQRKFLNVKHFTYKIAYGTGERVKKETVHAYVLNKP